MKRLALLIPVCGIVIGCMDETIAPAPPSPLPLPSFVITGTVLDEDGVPVAAAVAELVGLNNGTATDEHGQFRLTGARGVTTVRVRKEGWAPHLHTLFVAADQTINVTLRRAVLSDSIVLGATITGATAWPPCDPIRWDAQAPCRRFVFTAPASGVLVVSISWEGGPPLDALIYEGSHTLLAYSTDSGFDNATVNAPVVAGHGYEIRVNSYYNSQVFTLRADLAH